MRLENVERILFGTDASRDINPSQEKTTDEKVCVADPQKKRIDEKVPKVNPPRKKVTRSGKKHDSSLF
ncbi:MAG: hypothetical protein PF572_01880 [Patescibacteria group bacterium]|jgi:hypothetical protein|nr:hypothetical protein [Patescibacteria group bacterium]